MQHQTAINQLVKTQMSQKDASTMMAEAAGKRGYDLDFTSIPIFDGRNKVQFHEQYRCTEYTCPYSKRNLRQELLCRSAGAVTTVLLKMDKNLRHEKIKKILQEHFRERPTQLHASRELTQAQMRPDESVLIFIDRYTVLLEESTDEIPVTCSSKIITVTYIDALHDGIGRKLCSNIEQSEDDPHHPRAIRTLWDTMDQAQRLEKEQNFAYIHEAEIMNISPDSSPQNSSSESEGADINAIYGNRHYQSRNHRNWNSG